MRNLYVSILVLFLSLFSLQTSNAQCDVGFPTGNSIDLYLDNSGSGTLNETFISGYLGTSDPSCSTITIYDVNHMPLAGNSQTFDCAAVGTVYTFYVTLTDPGTPGSESAQAEFFINVIDNLPPTLVCPESGAIPIHEFHINTDANECYGSIAEVLLAPDILQDNCSNNTFLFDNLTWTWDRPISADTAGVGGAPSTAGNMGSMTAFEIGHHEIEYTAVDEQGNSTSCTFTVDVTDNQAPMAMCPADKAVNTEAGICSASNLTGINMTAGPVAIGPGEYYENCPGIVVQYEISGATTVALTTGTNHLDAGVETFELGVSTVTYHFTDAAMNSVSCSFNVTVSDMEIPVIDNSQMDFTVHTSSTAPFTCESDTTITHPSVSDNCMINNATYTVEINQLTPAAMAVVPSTVVVGGANMMLTGLAVGTYEVIYNVDDMSGNSATTFTYHFEVIDDEAPMIDPTKFDDVVINVVSSIGACNEEVDWYRPAMDIATDNCPGMLTFTEQVISGPDMTVLDGVIPFMPMNPVSPGALVDAIFPVGTTVIEYGVEDAAGNKASKTVTITVTDNTPPVAQCNGTVTAFLDAAGNASINTAMVNDNSYDNCGQITLSLDQSTFDCTDLGAPVTVTLTVMDTSSTSANSTCTSTVNVVDILPPTITNCPSDITVNTNGNANCEATATWVHPTMSDNCDVMTQTWTSDGGVTTNAFVNGAAASLNINANTTITYNVVDASGNSNVCSFVITLNDDDAPTLIGMPTDTTINANASCSAVHSWMEPTATDNCTAPGSIIITSNVASGNTFGIGIHTVTYSAFDGNGNVGTASFNVTVTDNQAPIAQCENVTIYLDNTPGAGSVLLDTAAIDDGSSDNCGIATMTLSQSIFTCGDIGDNTVTLTVSDGVLTDACSSTITVLDTFAPVCNIIPLLSPFDLNALGNLTINVTDIDNGSTDNCSITSMLMSIDGGIFEANHDFSCANIGIHSVDLQLIDQSFNSTTCSTTIEIKDVTAPTFDVPADITIQCDQSETDLSITGNVTNIVEACDPNPTVAYVDAIVFTFPTTYTITRTWTVTDASGNATSHDQIIMVEDTMKPNTTMAIVKSAVADPTTCTGTISIVFNDMNTSDNCSSFADLTITNNSMFGVNGTNNASGEYPIGVTIVTVTITDESNNTLVHTITVTVTDEDAPTVIFAPTNITQDNLTDNCFATVFFPRPDLTMATDCSGPITITESIDDYTVVPLTMFDENIGGMGVADFPVGVTTLTYAFSDAFGNTTNVSYTITVLDVQAPNITCPGNQTLGTVCASGMVPDYTNLVANLISDNCPNWTVTQSPVAGTPLSSLPGITPTAGESFTVTMTVTDNMNNMLSDNCSFDVELTNSQDPIAPILPPFVDSCGMAQVPTPVATDYCSTYNIYGIPSTASSTVPGTPNEYYYNPGFYFVTWTFIDNDGNTSTATQSISITEDTFAPIVNCPSNVTVNTDLGVCSTTSVDNIGITYFDHCGIASVSYTLTGATTGSGFGGNAGYSSLTSSGSNETFNKGTTTVTYVVVDNSGNSTTCSVNVTVEDHEGPVLSGVPASIIASCDNIPTVATVTANDNCDGNVTSSVVETTAQGVCPQDYTLTRTWTATDSEGNSTSLSQQIFVQDLTAPVVSSFPSTIDVNNDFGQCGATVSINLSDVFLSDNCAPTSSLTVTNNYTPNGADASGFYDIAGSPHTLIYTVTDPCGNSTTHNVVITVTDNQAPTPVCINNITLPVGALDSVVITSANININSFDNCTPQNQLQFDLNQTTFDCNDVSQDLEIIMTVTDLSGNSAFCTTSVEIQDNIAPIINCPIDAIVSCSADLDPYTNASLGVPTASDNCTVTTSYNDVEVSVFGDNCYTIERTWSATDAYGNQTDCVQYITVQDNIDPILSQGPASVTLGCSDNIPSVATLTGTDNCDDNVQVTFTSTSTQGTSGCSKYNYTMTRTWDAEDNCGGTDTYTQFITVEADETPVFLNTVPDTVNAVAHVTNQNSCGISDSLLTLDLTNMIDGGCYDYDDLYRRVHVVENMNQPLVGDGFLNANGYYPYGQYHIVYSLGDPCGNDTLTHTVVLNVTEDFSPTAICNDQLVVGLGSDGTVTITPDQLNNGSYDNCTPDNDLIITVINGTFDCSQLGAQEVTLSVEDASGNVTTCTSVVTITSDPTDPLLNLSVTASSTPESFYGASDGSVSVTATGGSGNYTYLWDDANASTTTTVNGLSFGTYTVVVTDTQSNCQFTATATITAGNQIALNVGTALGTAGTIVQVPVSVSNFNNVTSMTFSIHVVDNNIGSIVGLTTSNLSGSIANYSGNTATFGWVGPSTTIANNTEILSIGVMLTGNVGDNSPVNIDGTPTPVDVVIEINGVVTVVPVTINQGMVGIDNAAPTVELSGNIHRENGDNVGNATVNLTGSSSSSDVTGNDGNYFFIAASNSEITLTPEKDILPLEGVTAYDLSLILQHIVHDNPLSSNYLMVAADADNSSSITAYDLTVLLNMIVNPSTADFADYGNTSWRFIPEDFAFPTYDQYLDPIPAYPTSYTDNNVQNNTVQNFVGIKIGDVDQSANPLLLTTPVNNSEAVEGRSSINVEMNDSYIKDGDVIEVPVFASQSFDAIALQTSIATTSNLEIMDVIDFNLENLGAPNVNITEGGLNIAWFNDRSINITEGQLLFTLKIKANTATNLSQNISINNEILSSKVFNAVGHDDNLGLQFNNVLPLNSTFELRQNMPNPFTETTQIDFTLPTSEVVQLVIFNINGDIVYKNTAEYSKGINSVTLDKKDIGTSGIYIYQINSASHSAQKKMLLID